jgi:rhamnosyltransferase
MRAAHAALIGRFRVRGSLPDAHALQSEGQGAKRFRALVSPLPTANGPVQSNHVGEAVGVAPSGNSVDSKTSVSATRSRARPRVMRRASVIIRTKNEERALGLTLEAVLTQRVPPHEVLVIDSGSTDGTLLVAARYPVRVLTISPEEWGYPRALNRAAGEATGDVLVCLSAHCVPVDYDWLGNLLRHFEDPRVAGVWGTQLRPGRPLPSPGPPSCQERGTYGIHNRTWGLSNANSAVRRSLWERLPFNESMPATEDKEWGRAAMELGYCIVHDPAAGVWHGRHSVLDAYRRQRSVLRGFAMMFPELDRSQGAQLATAARAAWRTVRFHAANRELRVIRDDLRRAPASLAAIVGGLARVRRQ